MNIGIITGASSGMGKEFVKLTMQNHLELDEIWVIARRKERLEAWSDLYKEQKFRILPLDLQKKEDMDYLGKTLEEVQPHIELFIHCAGFGIMGRIQEISMDECFIWHQQQPFSLSRALRYMRQVKHLF